MVTSCWFGIMLEINKNVQENAVFVFITTFWGEYV